MPEKHHTTGKIINPKTVENSVNTTTLTNRIIKDVVKANKNIENADRDCNFIVIDLACFSFEVSCLIDDRQ